MREILFRAKDNGVLNGVWQIGSLDISYPDAPTIVRIDRHNNKMFVPILIETIGQYTGLTDKNGKKIFEGDIAKLYSNGYIPTEYIGEVMIKDGLAGIEYTPDYLRGKGFDPYFHHFGYVGEWRDMGASGKVTYSYEIIGNIHDNPELLKGGGE